jgi:hypothetical protein
LQIAKCKLQIAKWRTVTICNLQFLLAICNGTRGWPIHCWTSQQWHPRAHHPDHWSGL